MIQEIVEKWENNKHKLEKYFKETSQSEYSVYEKIVKKIFKLVINDAKTSYNTEQITLIDDGDYQGTLIFIIPQSVYQPSVDKYLMTSVYYGTCCGCDTLQAISDSDCSNKFPDEEQVKDYMLLALHLIQNMKKLAE